MNTDDHSPPSESPSSSEGPRSGNDAKDFVEAVADQIVDRLLDEVDGVSSLQSTEPLLELSDVAHYLQISDRTVETLIAEGQIEPIWIRGQRRFTIDAIEAYVRRRAQADKKCKTG